ncbi:MAG TPA: VOC family protein [Allosphingosinicella sp.]|jgi:catechol 2,3-dioxygenase-like lactoylglutathione lyase family enzyme
MGRFRQVTPFMHLPDIDAAVDFFETILGFAAGYREPGYAYVEREGCGFRLLQNQGSHGAPPGNRRFAYYIDVDDVDALHEELKPKLDTLPPGDVHGPADKPYGQRELLVLAPDGNLIAFGAPIGPKPVTPRT